MWYWKAPNCGKDDRSCSSFTVPTFVPAWQPRVSSPPNSETVVGGTTAVTDCWFGVCILQLDDCSSPFQKCSSPIRFLGRRQSEFCLSRVTAADSEVSITTLERSLSTLLETTRFCHPVFSTSPASCCDWRGVRGLKKEELSSLGLNIVTLPLALLSLVGCATRGCNGG